MLQFWTKRHKERENLHVSPVALGVCIEEIIYFSKAIIVPRQLYNIYPNIHNMKKNRMEITI